MFRRRSSAPTFSLTDPAPVSAVFGLDRGTPVDRYYIEAFLSANSAHIRGRVLELGDAAYTRRFGGDAVTQSDVLHAVAGNEYATFVGDLQDRDALPAGAFDCILLTQTLHVLLDPSAAVATCHHALAAGGCVLASLPGISQVSRYDADRWGDYWRVTGQGAQALFAPVFGADAVTVDAPGNAAAACAALQGLAAEELDRAMLDARHADYPVVVTVRATRE